MINNDFNKKLKEDFKSILDISYKYCETDDEELNLISQKINDAAYTMMRKAQANEGCCQENPGNSCHCN
jgi:hypothetical protein